jgi:glycosyltransferase involved in cell wall biosynthesis
LLEAVRRLALPKSELVLAGRVIGSGRALAPYRDLFRHVPHVPYGEVHRLYQEADIFAFPSLHEGSAFANLEAMASGLPVVTTPNAGSLVRDGEDGYVVPIRDVDALMARIEVLHRDRALRARMGASARARAIAHGWNRHCTELDAWLRRFDAEAA